VRGEKGRRRLLLDPDGNNIEAANHGKAWRSAPSVRLTF
jgi:hypothetical protein